MTTLQERATAYEGSRGRIDAMTRSLDDASLSTQVPCCPNWSVKDLVGHLTGVWEDRRDSHMPTGTFSEWTDEQVSRHRGESIGEVLDAWLAIPPAPSEDPPSLVTLVFDVVTHEHDLCHAIGIAGDRDSDGVRQASQRARERMAGILAAAGAPGILITTEDGVALAEGGADPIPLTTTRFELMRLATARMSRSQALGLDWGADAGPLLDALFADGFFTLQPRDVVDVDAR